MISWNKTSEQKPEVSKTDRFNIEHECSDRLLVHFSSKKVNHTGIGFGCYYVKSNTWVIEGHLGQYDVQYWSELNDAETENLNIKDLIVKAFVEAATTYDEQDRDIEYFKPLGIDYANENYKSQY